MFGKRLFKSRKGDDNAEEASASALPKDAVTSSFGTGCGEYSMEAYSLGQLSPDPIISPTNHRAPISSYARSILRDCEDNKQIMDDPHFDDISSMNEDSIYFGEGESNTIPGFSSPVRAELHSAMLDNCMSPGVSTILNDNDNDTDIQTVATGHAFSTVISPSIRSDLKSDVESSTVDRVVGPIKTDTSPSASESGKTEKETPVNSPREKEDSSERGTGFIARLGRAPLWLRIVFFGSIFLLFLAMLLAIFGLVVTEGGTSTKSNSNAAKFNNGNEDGFDPNYVPNVPSTPLPEEDPVELEPESTKEDLTFPNGSDPVQMKATTAPTSNPTIAPTFLPTSIPSERDQQKNKESPTNTPVASPLQTFAPALVSEEETPAPAPPETTVYITSGFLPANLKAQAETLLPKLPGSEEDSFLVHLGDWNDINSARSCNETEFQSTADFFSASSVPVYWSVGDNEFNDCSSPSDALETWKNTFIDYETQYWQPPPWTVLRQGELSAMYSDYTENLVFEHGQIVFLTINLVGSRVHNEQEFDSRLEANLAWIEFSYDFYKDSANMMVIFAHSGPDNGNPSNQDFYNDLLTAIEDDYENMQFVLISRGSNKWGIKKKHDGISNLYSVSVPGPLFPPMKMVFGDDEPKVVEVDWTAL